MLKANLTLRQKVAYLFVSAAAVLMLLAPVAVPSAHADCIPAESSSSCG